ncbi:MAG: hypothetical protein J6386_02965 [Candidatus Synoicihabitans palmerolidicus]|nr:hypothetical protein [Candidatus Synoicihabitans palmerolidicus]
MNTIRLILGLMIGGIEVAAGRRKGAVSSYTQARERGRPAWRAGRPLSLGKTPRWRRGRRAEDLEWWQKYNGASPPRNARRFMPVWPRATWSFPVTGEVSEGQRGNFELNHLADFRSVSVG